MTFHLNNWNWTLSLMILSFSNTVFKMQTIATIRVRIEFFKEDKIFAQARIFCNPFRVQIGWQLAWHLAWKIKTGVINITRIWCATILVKVDYLVVHFILQGVLVALYINRNNKRRKIIGNCQVLSVYAVKRNGFRSMKQIWARRKILLNVLHVMN